MAGYRFLLSRTLSHLQRFFQTDNIKVYGERAGHGEGRGGEQRQGDGEGVRGREIGDGDRNATEADQEEGEEQRKLLRQSSRKALNIFYLNAQSIVKKVGELS